MSTDDERQARLAQIRARLEDATPGPWYINQLDDEWSMSFVGVGTSPDDGTGDYAHHCYETLVAATLVQQPRYVDHADGRWDENAALIANAPDDLAWLLSELDAAAARAERRKPCPLSLEYRDGVACSEFGDGDACTSHKVVRGFRKHAVDADRWELRARRLKQALTAAYGIIHEGLHGGKPTDTEHQDQCEMPACRRIRAALAEGA